MYIGKCSITVVKAKFVLSLEKDKTRYFFAQTFHISIDFFKLLLTLVDVYQFQCCHMDYLFMYVYIFYIGENININGF